MSELTVFEVFGIENKEIRLSNLFAYYIKTSRAFLDLLCDLARIDRVLTNSKILIDREFYFTLEGYDNRHNYIDILVRIGDDENTPQRIICIENKIYANEGYKQTERYQKGMEKLFPNALKDYVFITKNNSFVNLSSLQFCQVRYMDLINRVGQDDNLIQLDYMKDFCEFYYERELRKYLDIEHQNTIPDNDSFIDYFVWKANSDPKYRDLYVCSGRSARNSNVKFLQISKQEWVIKNTGISDEMVIHLEGNNRNLRLHFETYPYSALSHLAENTRQRYEKTRDLLREKLNTIEMDDVHVSGPNKSETLTLVKFIIDESTDLKQTLDRLMKIVAIVDDGITHISV